MQKNIKNRNKLSKEVDLLFTLHFTIYREFGTIQFPSFILL